MMIMIMMTMTMVVVVVVVVMMVISYLVGTDDVLVTGIRTGVEVVG